MFKGKLPYQLILDCKDVNDLYRMVIENKPIRDEERFLLYPLYEVITKIIFESNDCDVIAEFCSLLVGDFNSRYSKAICRRIRRVLEEYIAEYLNEEIHYEASEKSREAVDELYRAYEPA
jgi:hypothetical protein